MCPWSDSGGGTHQCRGEEQVRVEKKGEECRQAGGSLYRELVEKLNVMSVGATWTGCWRSWTAPTQR